MRFAAVVVFIVECVLSHTPGDRSGRQSETLAKLSGVDEGLLRRLAHVFLFLVLGVLAGAGFGWIGIGAAAVWAVVDELTKPFIPGRHFSWIDELFLIIHKTGVKQTVLLVFINRCFENISKQLQ